MDEGFYVWFMFPTRWLASYIIRCQSRQLAGPLLDTPPKSFYFVNFFPSGTKFGPHSGKSHPMHFLSIPRVGPKSDSFYVMNFVINSPVYPSVQKEILLQREFPPGLAGKSFLFYLLLHFPSISHLFPIKTKNPQNWLFHPWWNFIYYFPPNLSHLA